MTTPLISAAARPASRHAAARLSRRPLLRRGPGVSASAGVAATGSGTTPTVAAFQSSV